MGAVGVVGAVRWAWCAVCAAAAAGSRRGRRGRGALGAVGGRWACARHEKSSPIAVHIIWCLLVQNLKNPLCCFVPPPKKTANGRNLMLPCDPI